MTDTDKPLQDLAALLASVLGGTEKVDGPISRIDELVLAELSARLGDSRQPASLAIGANERVARLAAYLDGGLEERENREVEATLASAPAELQDAIASLAHLDEVVRSRVPAPADLIAAAFRAEQARSASAAADVIPLRRPSRGNIPMSDSFQLLAAAGGADHGAMLCRSQSGIWTLEVFVGTSDADRKTNQGYLLLSVHPDHRATYEGRTVRVFVRTNNQERNLAEDTVRNGEVYTAISLAGLDLWTRDAVNIVFGPGPEAS